MADAVAKAAGVPATAVRRALMLRGDLAGGRRDRARRAAAPGSTPCGCRSAARSRRCSPGTAADIPAALEKIAPAAVDWKLDGARIQVHRDGDDVAIYTRTLDDVTARLPEVVAVARALPATRGRARRRGDRAARRRAAGAVPGHRRAVRHAAGRAASRSRRCSSTSCTSTARTCSTRRCAERTAALERDRARGAPDRRAPSPRTPTAAQAAFDAALAAGHEGVVVKALDAPYAAGRRGSGWLKVKPVHTLDLVVLAAEWGHGRRRGKLSNLHLGARDEETGGWAMLGKTFKGLTDELLAWQTERLLALQTHREGIAVHVRPELVVEIAFDGVQTSSRYPSGMALRFARVKRYREDKPAAEADTVATVRAIRDGGAWPRAPPGRLAVPCRSVAGRRSSSPARRAGSAPRSPSDWRRATRASC